MTITGLPIIAKGVSYTFNFFVPITGANYYYYNLVTGNLLINSSVSPTVYNTISSPTGTFYFIQQLTILCISSSSINAFLTLNSI